MTTDILIIEDEHALASALAAACRRLGYTTRLCASGARGLEEAARQMPAAILLDIGLPDMTGLQVLEQLRARSPAPPVIIITAHGNLDNAMAARQLGAAAYLVKPLDLGEVQQTISDVIHAAVPPVPALPSTVSLLVGAAPVMQRCFVEITHACASEAPVLLNGPTGTGKTLAARIIHQNSARRDGPFVALHCGALPETLLESELFGHEKHAFTGAGGARLGHVERAHGGTLFLDEIGDISLAVQAKLLRVVEEKVFTRLGGREDLRIDVRVITATHKDLREEVRAQRFREDLYYRLHVLEITLPPLAARRSDVPALAAYFLGTLSPESALSLAPSTMELLERHSWPGNVRELRNAMEHAVAVANGPTILPHHLPRGLRHEAAAAGVATEFDCALNAWLQEKVKAGTTYAEISTALETLVLKHLLAQFGGKPTPLARQLKMNRVTLRRRTRGVKENPTSSDDGEEDSASDSLA